MTLPKEHMTSIWTTQYVIYVNFQIKVSSLGWLKVLPLESDQFDGTFFYVVRYPFWNTFLTNIFGNNPQYFLIKSCLMEQRRVLLKELFTNNDYLITEYAKNRSSSVKTLVKSLATRWCDWKQTATCKMITFFKYSYN